MSARAGWLLGVLLIPVVAAAHGFLPGVIEVRLGPASEHELRIRPPQLAPGDDRRFEPRVGPPCSIRADRDVWRVSCSADELASARVELVATAGAIGLPAPEVYVDLRWPDGRRELGVAGASGRTDAHASVSRLDVRAGVDVILSGVDHVLLIVGLVALAGRWRRALSSLVAFSAGATLMLLTVAAGAVRLSSATVPVVVALTLLLLGRSLASPDSKVRGTSLAFVFGLTHGGVFAGVLVDRAAGITEQVLAYNLGLGVGQIAVAIAAWLLWVVLRRIIDDSIGRRMVAYALGVASVVLVLDRLPGLVPG